MNSNFEISIIFKALCDENRIEIIKLINNRELCACEIYDKLSVTKATVSHHMKILIESGIVCARKEGKWTYYSLNQQGIKNAKFILNELF